MKRLSSLLLALALSAAGSGCATREPAAAEPRVPAFKPVEKSDHVVFPSAEELAALEAPVDPVLHPPGPDAIG